MARLRKYLGIKYLYVDVACAIFAVMLTLFVVGCGSSVKDGGNVEPDTTEVTTAPRPVGDVQSYTLPDSRTVQCVVLEWGVSCDWDHAS